MSEETLEEALDNLEERMKELDTEMCDIEDEELSDYIGSDSLEDQGTTEYDVAEEIADEAPELLEIGGEIYTSASALKFYEFEGELPENADIVLRAEELGAGEGREYEQEFSDMPYNIKVQERVNPRGLRRIL